MNYIKRDKCVVTGKEDLEPLYKLIDFPIFIGCTEQDQDEDLVADMEWSISKGSGVIQLTKLLPLNLVYSEFHSEAVGNVWEEHRKKFSDFIIKHTTNNSIVEMGGSNGSLAELCLKKSKDIISWTIVEPNPDPDYQPINNKITVIESFIEDQLEALNDSTVFVHSHVFEHLYDPLKTLMSIADRQIKSNKMIFSIPDLYKYLDKKYANSINFEHTYFITEKVMDALLGRLGYIVKSKYYFEEHSIFYCTEYTGISDLNDSINFYPEYKKMYLDMIKYYKEEVIRLNNEIENFKGEVYLFGGHIFSQFLIYMGLNVENVSGIIDNSKDKEGKRLYGSALNIYNPKIISKKDSVMVIAKAGQYQIEIEEQLRHINKNIYIVS